MRCSTSLNSFLIGSSTPLSYAEVRTLKLWSLDFLLGYTSQLISNRCREWVMGMLLFILLVVSCNGDLQKIKLMCEKNSAFWIPGDFTRGDAYLLYLASTVIHDLLLNSFSRSTAIFSYVQLILRLWRMLLLLWKILHSTLMSPTVSAFWVHPLYSGTGLALLRDLRSWWTFKMTEFLAFSWVPTRFLR